MPSAALIAPHAPMVDMSTGHVTREWFRYLMSIAALLGGGADVSSLESLQSQINALSAKITKDSSDTFFFTAQASPFTIALGKPASYVTVYQSNGDGTYTLVGMMPTVDANFVLTFNTGGGTFTGKIVIG